MSDHDKCYKVNLSRLRYKWSVRLGRLTVNKKVFTDKITLKEVRE